MAIQPFVVGQWVRGERFYGRRALVEEILDGHRNWLWLLGTRRIGKTSLLKQIEHLATEATDRRYFPVFWDFQGAEDHAELYAGFTDALLDAEVRLEALGIAPEDVETEDLFGSLSRLRRHLRSRNLRLLLLCDEVEELIKLHRADPSLLRKLRRAMQSTEDIRSVLASTIRLWDLADQREDTSPFLHGFTPPLYIHGLADDESLELIRQTNLPATSRPDIDEVTGKSIRRHCDNHPYLLQLVSKRFCETGSLENAIEQVATDPMVNYFFSVDFEMLSSTERQVLRLIARRTSPTSRTIQQGIGVKSDSLTGLLHRLIHLGYVHRNSQGGFDLANYFFRRWFCEQPESEGAPDSSPSDSSLDETVAQSNEPAVVVSPGSFGERYELLEFAGQGATGTVYRALDRVLQTEIALKILRSEYADNQDALERFRKEIVLTLDINHPNILRVYHLGEHEGQKYLTMKWIDGRTLADEITEREPFPVGQIIRTSAKLASALDALHSHGVLHRDIKPHNILIDAGSEPFLTDFGLVRLLDQPGTTRAGVFLGTPDYASPEQATMLDLDVRSDIYSLGLVIFEMAAGQRPFSGDSTGAVLEAHRSHIPPDPRDLRRDLPVDLGQVILRCLEKQREHRFDSARDLQATLERIETA